jgi:hypothetical protein
MQQMRLATESMPVDDQWRRWIAENLLLDIPPTHLVKIMAANGIGESEAAAELKRATESPYLRGAERIRNRLKKREWGYDVQRKLRRLQPSFGRIDRRHRLSRDAFLSDYYAANRPVLITGMIDDWPALAKWNLNFLQENFGDREIELQGGRNAERNYEVKQQALRRRMRFGDYVKMLKAVGRTNDFYVTANNSGHNRKALGELWNDIVQVTEYLDPATPGNDGLIWIGPAGTVTPLHHDLTNNFMAQVCGRKLVRLIPPWETPRVYNHFHVYSEVDAGPVVPADRLLALCESARRLDHLHLHEFSIRQRLPQLLPDVSRGVRSSRFRDTRLPHRAGPIRVGRRSKVCPKPSNAS